MDQRVSLVTLAVADVAASRAFYERLGWVAHAWSNPSITFFQTGCMVVALYDAAALAADTGMATPRPGGITLALNVSTREAVAAGLEEVVAAGAALLKPATEMPWGGVTGYFADPDGHPWEISWLPTPALGEGGALVLP
jgi:catechol 2,3-dioxygenase-like lactoylglutathione lyase family enzyme